ncbi:ABC transporter ATP-binding protein [Hydrogenophaga sp. NFH-34]|uniref:ABC transporter ATP-binding protein n=1 Tax=Hydrogenophaga sp. NFH-34 TaxID=2744446 RepID=UPI001F3FEA2F|nr:ABC transporter ATP-binding protein [Hydrogenophaga sp. NFH-34]
MSTHPYELLRVEDLRVAYGEVQAVKNASLTVGAHQIVSLVGSNGAGKTTLLRAISGVLPLQAGRVVFGGQDITRLPVHARVGIGLAHVPEGRHVFGPLTIAENLRLGAYSGTDKPAIRRRMEEMFELFPILAERRSQQAGTMSGGEQQMLAIARALMSQPRLLILDEPTMGLSPKMIGLVLETLVRIRSQQIPILLVEQNTVEAIRMADTVYALRVGEIVAQMPGTDVTEDVLKHFYLG